MRPLVLLYDIDGTLISAGGAGRRAVERAFAGLHGRPDACAGISFAGMTDRAISRAGLRAIGLLPSLRGDEAAGPDASTEARATTLIDELIARYLELLAEEVATGSGAYKIHAGVEAALERSLRRAGCAVGLGTGNVEPGARIKLAQVEIDALFSFGGYGSDAEDRAELLRIGAERGARRLGLPLSECRTVVIGDTPRDVAAALAIGAECLAVGTGPFSPSELAASGASYAFPDLASPGALEILLRA